jgi:carboxypeptidase Q
MEPDPAGRAGAACAGGRARAALTAAVLFALTVAPAPPAGPATAPAARPPLAERYREPAARLIGAALASDHAMLRMSQLCDGFGHRITGSEALERAARWAADAMKEDGLERVQLQPVRVPRWVRGEERATLVEPGPRPLAMLGLGRSPGTPPGGIEADVVAVASWAELDSLPDDAVRGRIVLYDVPYTTYDRTVNYRSRGPRRAAMRGAVAALVRSVGPVSLRTPHTGSMAAPADSAPTVPGAAVTIEDATMMRRLLARGERVRVRLEMGARTLSDSLSHNVLGEIRGRERPDEVVVIGGHLDSWDVGQGAQDDAGGCVISMEALRLIRALGLRPRRTLRCVLWTNEEYGARGGQAYADSARRERHVAAVESDGGVEAFHRFAVGVRRTGTDSTDAARTAIALARLAPLAPLLAGLGTGGITDGGGDTDTGPLMKLGVPGVSHRTTMQHYFDWHHTDADMLDKVDPIELRKNVAAMAVLAYVLADMEETLADPAQGPTGSAAPAATPASTRRSPRR